MHIAFLTPEYPHSATGASGGLGTSIKNLAHQLVVRGIEVTVIVSGQKVSKTFKEDNIWFHIIPQKNYPILGFYFYRKFLQIYINKLVKTVKIDLIEAPDWTGLTAFMNLNVPLVIRFHGTDAYFCKLEGRRQKKKNFLFEKLALSGADRLLSVSNYTAKITTEIFKLKKDVTIIPNSIDVKVFQPSVPKKNKFDIILYFGSLIRKKGVLELAEIFNIVVETKPSAKLLLVGKDVIDVFENRSTFELLKGKLSPIAFAQTQYVPEVNYNEIKDYITSASVIALPSFAEALPMSWLEAMAMEKALVTSNIGWANEIMINGKTGFTESPENHSSYADRILELMNNKKLAMEMGKDARNQVIKKFSGEVVTKRNLEFYKEVITNS